MKKLLVTLVLLFSLGCVTTPLPPPPEEPMLLFYFSEYTDEWVLVNAESLVNYLDYVGELEEQNEELRGRAR